MSQRGRSPDRSPGRLGRSTRITEKRPSPSASLLLRPLHLPRGLGWRTALLFRSQMARQCQFRVQQNPSRRCRLGQGACHLSPWLRAPHRVAVESALSAAFAVPSTNRCRRRAGDPKLGFVHFARVSDLSLLEAPDGRALSRWSLCMSAQSADMHKSRRGIVHQIRSGLALSPRTAPNGQGLAKSGQPISGQCS